MKKCNDCECIFSEKYTICPSCQSSNIGNYKTLDYRYTEAKDDALIEQMGAFVEFTDLKDLEIE